MTWEIREGDSLELLRQMPDESVQCVVTSPPYWGLRDYGVDGQMGLEETPDEHMARMVELFREVRRVLRSDGTCWVNYGDAYASSGARGHGGWDGNNRNPDGSPRASRLAGEEWGSGGAGNGRKPKDLLGLPWMLAFALRADGWWLRSEIIWHKPNPMPESVTDRPTKAHEHLFLLTKSARYFYDADAIRQPHAPKSLTHRGGGKAAGRDGCQDAAGRVASGNMAEWDRARVIDERGVNARTVWTINPQPFAEAHFATFPEALPERCILAGTSAHGCCSSCGAPWTRVVEKGAADVEQQRACGGDAAGVYNGEATKDYGAARAQDPSAVKARILAGMRERRTVSWEPSCDCSADVVPCMVLDPFAGAGTTLLVAERLGRDSIGCELNPEYARIARERIRAADPMASVEVAPGRTQHSLFGEVSA